MNMEVETDTARCGLVSRGKRPNPLGSYKLKPLGLMVIHEDYEVNEDESLCLREMEWLERAMGMMGVE